MPKGWAWCRLGDIGEIIGGGTPSTSIEEYWNGEISWITPADLSNYSDKYIAQGKRNITQLGLENSSATLIPKGGILFSTRAPIGSVVIADRPLSTNQGFKSLYPFIDISKEFIYYFLLAEKEKIKLFASGTTFQELSASAFSKILIPLPPLAEQHRIAQKVEQLLTIVDTIEQLQEELKALVKQTRNQVLNYAIAGKLTHQDPNDEPAEELLKRIGKATAPDTPYEKLPEGWAWCRLGEVCCFENGYAFNSDDYQKNGTPLIRISNIKNGKIDISEAVFIKIEYDKRFMVEYGDLLIAMSGATTGKMGVYKLDREAVLNQRVGNIKIRNKDIFFHKFRNYIMQTKSDEILKMAYGGAQPNISGKMIENLTIPLPPLQEQYRIVQKIETYFSFLDAIENSL